MKNRRNLIVFSLVLAAVLTGCGNIEEEAAAPETTESVSTSVGSVDEESSSAVSDSEEPQESDSQEDTETQTAIDQQQPPETTVQGTEEPEVTSLPDTALRPDGTAGTDKPEGELVTPENIDGYMFGFELYNDGHKDCWEQRYDCAKVMLEAVAQTNAAENYTDLIVTAAQLNEKETSGFMTWLKFEEPMTFNVGKDAVMGGSSLNIIDYDGSYYFFFGEIEEMNGMIKLDSSYIPKILEAAGCGN